VLGGTRAGGVGVLSPAGTSDITSWPSWKRGQNGVPVTVGLPV
jgi:hypothetical protein